MSWRGLTQLLICEALYLYIAVVSVIVDGVVGEMSLLRV
jgi:hypothetical protein